MEIKKKYFNQYHYKAKKNNKKANATEKRGKCNILNWTFKFKHFSIKAHLKYCKFHI